MRLDGRIPDLVSELKSDNIDRFFGLKKTSKTGFFEYIAVLDRF